ncbi:uncharacterized protein [Triticum aestivum]|uniref:uncharacterized protein n=1 Tax=Triticum aestivum TaxID=4565 RepID=UPI001D029000|nr:uncharacterized protein LOC123184656 [Triticum aestivum]
MHLSLQLGCLLPNGPPLSLMWAGLAELCCVREGNMKQSRGGRSFGYKSRRGSFGYKSRRGDGPAAGGSQSRAAGELLRRAQAPLSSRREAGVSGTKGGAGTGGPPGKPEPSRRGTPAPGTGAPVISRRGTLYGSITGQIRNGVGAAVSCRLQNISRQYAELQQAQ